jgi:plasmid maintenance system antidote protein VapI
MARKKREPEPITDALRNAIRKEGYTAYRLSKMTGSSIDSIQRFIDGKQGLTLRTVERLAAVLDLVLVPKDQAERKAP